MDELNLIFSQSQYQIATEEPLCLDPSPMVTVLSNQIHYHQTSAALRTRKKRKWNSLEREQEAARKLEEDKLMSMMDEVKWRGLKMSSH